MKKGLLIASVIFLVLFGSLQLYIFFHQPTPVEELRQRVPMIPNLSLTGLDGSSFRLERGSPIVLIYFNSDCDHCQREFLVIKKKIDLFDSLEVVLMSSQPLGEIQSFSKEIDLGQRENVRFGQIKPEVLADVFGILSLPQIFVFSKDGSLIAVFSGETEPGAILEVLR